MSWWRARKKTVDSVSCGEKFFDNIWWMRNSVLTFVVKLFSDVSDVS